MLKTFYSFLKDNISFSISFFTNSIIICVFYNITLKKPIEIIYPFTLSLFIYVISMIYRWTRYYRFNININFKSDDIYYDLNPLTYEQKQMDYTMKSIQKYYLLKINNINSVNKKNKEFISQWIHNMKTPISVIDLIIQKLNKDEIDYSTAIKDIQIENKRLQSSLELVLNILRLEEFAIDYLPNRTNLTDSIRKIINLKKSEFVYNNVFPKFDNNKEVFILSDKKWNEIILEQIISNAIKYSVPKESSKRIFFKIEEKKDTTTLIVKDEGVGIPEYDIKRVFEAFFTGENGRKYKNSSGIGLYICMEIANKLGHGLKISSTYGVGTTVSIIYKKL